MGVEFITARGAEILPWISDAARLRISVFREYPYLYLGTMEHEQEYLRTYAESRGSFFVIARSEGRVVGVSTSVPLAEETEEVQRPFVQAGIPAGEVFYFGESVLEPQMRGQGIGVRFMEEREANARRTAGIRRAVFCAVDRAEDHPRRPAGYVPLDEFWKRRGFAKTGMQTQFTWREEGEESATPKTLTFWEKLLV
jgi:GNAT superfamily N-acetyltransferase